MHKDFMDLFHGLDRAHGTYAVDNSRADGKMTGKAATFAKPVTEELWIAHLEGKRSLGIIPINDDSKCRFGAIDIDVYKGLNIHTLAKKVKSLDLPLVAIRSKSGGCHLYLFTNEWVSAGLLQSKLRELAAGLGYGTCEIFPKQTQLLVDRGDIGQWINMPYFGGDGTNRYAIDASGKKLSAKEFITFARATRVDIGDLESAHIDVNEILEDGPPCLQFLASQGIPEGNRNDGLYNFGVYLKKAFPDIWEMKLEEWNHKFFKPQLSSTEVQGVIKSLRRKEYQYTCSKPPIVAHCNSALCRLRKFGIGGTGSLPVMHSLTKYASTPPLWFIDVEGSGRMELTTEDLQNQTKFQKRCMEALNVMPMPLNKVAWTQIINHLLENVTIIVAPADASPVGQLMEMVERFCTGRAQAKVKEEILLGKPFLDPEKGRHYFRLSDLMSYLERHRYREFKVHQITAIIKNHGADHHFFNLKGKGINCWSLSSFDTPNESFDIPKEIKDDRPEF